MKTITPELLAQIFVYSKQVDREASASHINNAMLCFDITSNERQCAFLSTIGHETGHLKSLVENLNYSAKGLVSTWPSRFETIEFAEEYAHNPEKIANYVYGGRYGNTLDGDGWKYRGRGAIQTTFKDNYSALNALGLGVDFVSNPDLLTQWDYATLSAAAYWSRKGLNEISDELNSANEYEVYKSIVKRVNGGYNGLDDRWGLYVKAKQILEHE